MSARWRIGQRPSLFTFAASAVLAAVRDLTGQTDCSLIYSASRRSTRQAASMIGYLSNKNLLRVQMPKGANFPEVAESTREALLSSLDHQMMPSDHLIRILCPDEVGRQPRSPYITLNVDKPFTAPNVGAAKTEMAWPMDNDGFREMPWVAVNLEELPDGMLELGCAYQASLMDEQFIREFISAVASYLIDPAEASGPEKRSVFS